MTTGILYIVATPIGNLKDITFRAIETLKSVDLIVCEDTRKSKVLLDHYQIKTKCISYHDHSTQKDRERIMSFLQSGKRLALISDGGTPLISDPGFKLVRDCIQQNITVTPIPGASSVISGLSVAGIPTDNFLFLGFLPVKNKDRLAKYTLIKESMVTAVILEAPSKLLATLEEIRQNLGDIHCTLAKELTKLHETITYQPISQHIEALQANKIRGEYVIILEAVAKQEITDEVLISELTELLQKLSVKSASEFLAAKYKMSKKHIYNIALKFTHQSR
ncbi:MAG: 16S rRNA (cytidine(1402)-2'-O)-methyltransferase [Rickettsiales bacterium]